MLKVEVEDVETIMVHQYDNIKEISWNSVNKRDNVCRDKKEKNFIK